MAIGEHELDLLLERVEGLARDGADGEHGAEPGAIAAAPLMAPVAATRRRVERMSVQRKLVIGEVGMPRPQLMDVRLDGRLASADHLRQRA